MSDFLSDVRHAIRSTRRSAAFFASAVALLAVGVALSTVTFGLVRGYLLRPLPYPDSTRVVQLLPDDSRTFANIPRGLETIDVASMTGTFADTAAWDIDGFTVVGGDQPEFVDGAWVNPGFFSIVGAQPFLGRLLSADDVRTAARVAVISHGYWQRRFGGRADVINQTLRAYSTDRPLSGDLFTIVGVLRPDFWHLNSATDILAPLNTPRFPSLARLAPGVTMSSAIEALNRAGRSAIPSASPEWRMGLALVQHEYSRQIRPTLLVLFAAVACVLLVACANVAGLLIVRGVSRRREFAIRAALGAGRGRLVRQQLVESLVLALAASAGSVWLTFVSVDVIATWMETQLGVGVPGGAGSVRLDWALVSFTAATALMAGLVAGLRPAFSVARTDAGVVLATSSRGDAAGHGRFRGAMVVSQIALSFLLLAGAGLMVQSLLALQRSELGFTPDGVLKGHVQLPQARYADRPSRIAAVRDVLGQVRSLPGIESVATVMPHPFRFQGSQPLFAEGASSVTQAVHHVIAGDYWRTMGVRIVEGRAFDDRDRAGSERVAVISRGLARQLWPDASPIGRRIRTSAATDAPWLTIVGVSVDVRKTFTEAIVGDTYVPYDQAPGGYLALLARSAGDPLLMAQPIQRRLAGVAPDLPLHEVEPMTTVLDRQARQQRFLATLLGGFAAATAAIAVVGLYAVLTFTVALRRREIAVRVAVGANRRQIGVAVIREGAVLVGAGLIAGVAMCVMAARGISAQLFGVAALDIPTFALAALVFGLVSLAAVTAPALRAARVDAVEALRID